MSILYTERLTLRPFCETDAKAMFENWTYDERVAKYCRWTAHTSVSMTEQLLSFYLKEQNEGFTYRWAITLDGKMPIGAIDVVDILDNGKTAIIGYVLSYEYWNKGIATESLKCVIDYLFENGFTKIVGRFHPDNIASGRVMEKCGMKFCGYTQEKRKYGSDETCKVKVYSIKQ